MWWIILHLPSLGFHPLKYPVVVTDTTGYWTKLAVRLVRAAVSKPPTIDFWMESVVPSWSHWKGLFKRILFSPKKKLLSVGSGESKYGSNRKKGRESVFGFHRTARWGLILDAAAALMMYCKWLVAVMYHWSPIALMTCCCNTSSEQCSAGTGVLETKQLHKF